MKKQYPKAIPGETRWVDYDDETESWGVFGADSGHCYSTHTTKGEADAALPKEPMPADAPEGTTYSHLDK
jgi:hypothetical protein